MPKLIDLTGQKFEKLTVLKKHGNDKTGLLLWLCICDCGNEKITTGENLRKGDTKSCGCLFREVLQHTIATKKVYRGKEHPCYNPNITDEERINGRKYIEYYEWRIAVYKRDNFTCQCCGQEDVSLNAHHILNYSIYKELRTSIDNGITLCKQCHKEFHQFYGNRNNNEIQLIEFFIRKSSNQIEENLYDAVSV